MARLKGAIEYNGWRTSFEPKPVAGDIKRDSFVIWKRICYRNSFQPTLIGSFVPDGKGTIVYGEFGIHPTVRTMWIVLLFVAGCFGLLSFAGMVLAGPPSMKWLAVPSILFIFPFGLGMRHLSKLLSWGEDVFLREFITHVLQTEETNPR